MENASTNFYPELLTYLHHCMNEWDLIPAERKQELEQLGGYVRQQLQAGRSAKLIFICTHNSRRSHLSQIWAHIAAQYYGLNEVETYSGGTEATAFNPRAVSALRHCGLKIEADDLSLSNPIYLVRSSDASPALICFSKVFDQTPNPTRDYCAIMTCSQADDACPVVSGCELRLPIRYDDPKLADDTPAEAARYAERSRQICREMLYALHQAVPHHQPS
jgi:arsenate reductase